MRTFDLTPLLRSSIGFDHIHRLTESLDRLSGSDAAYPPYNIEKLTDDDYRLSMAVAGFSQDQLDVTVEDDALTIAGQAEDGDNEREFLHRGIARRAFQRRFQLAENIKVTGANLENGLLTVELAREVPEHKRPRSIDIKGGGTKAIEKKAA